MKREIHAILFDKKLYTKKKAEKIIDDMRDDGYVLNDEIKGLVRPTTLIYFFNKSENKKYKKINSYEINISDKLKKNKILKGVEVFFGYY